MVAGETAVVGQVQGAAGEGETPAVSWTDPGLSSGMSPSYSTAHADLRTKVLRGACVQEAPVNVLCSHQAAPMRSPEPEAPPPLQISEASG